MSQNVTKCLEMSQNVTKCNAELARCIDSWNTYVDKYGLIKLGQILFSIFHLWPNPNFRLEFGYCRGSRLFFAADTHICPKKSRKKTYECENTMLNSFIFCLLFACVIKYMIYFFNFKKWRPFFSTKTLKDDL